MGEDRVSNRDKKLAQDKTDLQEAGMGDLIAEMVTIGDPDSVHNKRQKHIKVRFTMLKDELNSRKTTRLKKKANA